MSRTSAREVQDILGGNYDSEGSPSLAVYIRTAGVVVDRAVALAAEDSVTYASGTLALIEAWLAAHYYTQMDPTYASRSTDRGSGSFREQDFKAVALELDAYGYLSTALSGGPVVATGSWLGKTRSERLNYHDRIGY
jgi:hypothetical protein